MLSENGREQKHTDLPSVIPACKTFGHQPSELCGVHWPNVSYLAPLQQPNDSWRRWSLRPCLATSSLWPQQTTTNVYKRTRWPQFKSLNSSSSGMFGFVYATPSWMPKLSFWGQNYKLENAWPTWRMRLSHNPDVARFDTTFCDNMQALSAGLTSDPTMTFVILSSQGRTLAATFGLSSREILLTFGLRCFKLTRIKTTPCLEDWKS